MSLQVEGFLSFFFQELILSYPHYVCLQYCSFSGAATHHPALFCSPQSSGVWSILGLSVLWVKWHTNQSLMHLEEARMLNTWSILFSPPSTPERAHRAVSVSVCGTMYPLELKQTPQILFVPSSYQASRVCRAPLVLRNRWTRKQSLGKPSEKVRN